MHHIISDGYSINILTNELLALYHQKPLPDIEFEYKDFAEWQNQWLNEDAMKQAGRHTGLNNSKKKSRFFNCRQTVQKRRNGLTGVMQCVPYSRM